MMCGAISTPTAKPTAATHSQNSFRPKNKTTTPISMPTIAVEECIDGRAVWTAIALWRRLYQTPVYLIPAPDTSATKRAVLKFEIPKFESQNKSEYRKIK